MLKKEILQNLMDRTRREFRRKYCLHPEAPKGCSQKIIAAHSVQRALLKKFITSNGHVIKINVSAQVDPVGMLVQPESIGVNDATTFSGFCAKHDSGLFAPLEASEFRFLPHQIALLGYRAICRELYSKEAETAAAESVDSYCSVNPHITGFPEKHRRHQVMQAARHNARINLINAKKLFSETLSDESNLRYYCVEFSKPPVYFNSVAFLPEWDFEGRELQDLSSISEFKPICFSAWAAGNSAAAVFCWHETASHICIPFIDSLRRINPTRLANRIVSMAMEVSDNVVFQVNWWKSLSESDRRKLSNRALSGVGEFERKSSCLTDDDLKAIESSVSNEYVGY